MQWTQQPPTEGGDYWHWCGDYDYAPNVMHISLSGTTGKCFIQMGQLGFTRAVDCDEYGGWWMKLEQPELPVDYGNNELRDAGRTFIPSRFVD